MKKEVLKIATIFLITIGVVLWGLNFIFFKGNAPKSKATGETMNLSFTPATATVAANADFTVTILAKPSINTVLRGYKTKVNFDKAILKLKSIKYKVGVVSAGLGNTTSDVATVNTNGFIDIVGEDTTAVGNTLTAANGAELVSLTFKALVATATTVTMTDSSFYSVNADGTLFDTWTIAAQNLNVNGGSTCTSFTDDFSGTTINTDKWASWSNNNTNSIGVADGQGTFYITQGTASNGQTIYSKTPVTGDFTIEVTLKNHSTLDNKLTSNFFLRLANVDWTQYMSVFKPYNKAPGELGVSWKEGTVDKDLGINDEIDHNTNVRVKIERIGSTFKTYYLLDGGQYKLLKQIDNYYDGPMNYDIGLDNWGPDFPQASANFDDFKLTCGGGTTGNVKLNLKLKFQGIVKQPATAQNSMTVKVKVQKDGETTSVDGTGTFVADAAGVWTGTVGVNIPTVSGKYKIMVKGPHHIQKKICDSTPTETAGPGLYKCANGNITLVAGDNNLDFSGILLLAGDLDQSGIVDSVDFGLVRNNLGKTDAATLAQADINRDGKVDTQDFSLIIAALGIRTDEL